jgi:TetR/AcrR family transcriptional repressor of nem operon
MARPREFDEEEVLERALEVFWTRGYEATSLTDLMEATGLAKGSVYKGFGDKHSFFLRTLDRYLARGRALYAALDDGSRNALSILRDWLVQGVEMSTGGGLRKGCFGVNCTVELAPHDPEVRKRMRDHERRLEAMYARTIQRGIEEASMRPDLDPHLAARFVTTTVGGVQVAAKTGMSRAEALGMVELTLAALAKPGPTKKR